MNPTIIIVGGSVRAAAQSARRAGHRPWLADLFADRDTLAAGPTVRIENYPYGLLELFCDAPDCPWMYTGALENYPDLVDQLAAIRPLVGVSGETLRRVRDPFELARVLESGGFPVPEVRASLPPSCEAGEWLRKTRRSSAGRGVVRIDATDCAAGDETLPDVYYQRRIAGQPISAAFKVERGEPVLLGVTMQLIGDDASPQRWCTANWTGARDYWYAGSVGPIAFSIELEHQVRELGSFVANSFTLAVPFGIDGILASDTFWPIEINPRYTASIEVIERRQQAAGGGRQAVAVAVAGKAVIYASGDLAVSERLSEWADAVNVGLSWPSVADIPHTGSAIAAGAPICTVLAAGECEGEVMDRLRELAERAHGALATAIP